MERSYVMLKPGVLNRRIAGEIISRLEKKGLKLVGMKLLKITAQLADRHYAEHKDKDFYADLKSYITSGPVIGMVFEAENCVSIVRKLVGSTKVADAQPGTIRGDYALHTNLIWISNARTVNLQVQGDTQTTDIAVGKAGQVVVEDIRWIYDKNDGTYKLVVQQVD